MKIFKQLKEEIKQEFTEIKEEIKELNDSVKELKTKIKNKFKKEGVIDATYEEVR